MANMPEVLQDQVCNMHLIQHSWSPVQSLCVWHGCFGDKLRTKYPCTFFFNQKDNLSCVCTVLVYCYPIVHSPHLDITPSFSEKFKDTASCTGTPGKIFTACSFLSGPTCPMWNESEGEDSSIKWADPTGVVDSNVQCTIVGLHWLRWWLWSPTMDR